MGYTNIALKNKIVEMYSEVEKRGISVSLDFSEEKNAFVIKFRKGSNELTTNLDRKDADECMNGIKCVYLGMQVAEFIKNFEEIEKA